MVGALQSNANQRVCRSTVRVDIRVEHPLMRAGLRAALQEHADVALGDDGGDRALASPSAWLSGADVVVVEAGPRVLSLLAQLPTGQVARIVAVAAPSAELAIFSVIRAGVRALVSEWAVDIELPLAVRAVAAGGAYVSPQCTGALLDWLVSQLPEDPARFRRAAERLSEREREVLLELGKGTSNARIAKTLVISETTVRSHVYHILNKLNLQTRTEAVLFGYQFRLIAADPTPTTRSTSSVRSGFSVPLSRAYVY